MIELIIPCTELHHRKVKIYAVKINMKCKLINLSNNIKNKLFFVIIARWERWTALDLACLSLL